MIGPGIVPYTSIDSLVRVAGAFCPELPDGPIVPMFGVEKGNEAVKRVAVGSLGICLARSGGYDNVVCYIAKIQTCLSMLSSWAGDYLSQEGGHVQCFAGPLVVDVPRNICRSEI